MIGFIIAHGRFLLIYKFWRVEPSNYVSVAVRPNSQVVKRASNETKTNVQCLFSRRCLRGKIPRFEQRYWMILMVDRGCATDFISFKSDRSTSLHSSRHAPDAGELGLRGLRSSAALIVSCTWCCHRYTFPIVDHYLLLRQSAVAFSGCTHPNWSPCWVGAGAEMETFARHQGMERVLLCGFFGLSLGGQSNSLESGGLFRDMCTGGFNWLLLDETTYYSGVNLCSDKSRTWISGYFWHFLCISAEYSSERGRRMKMS